MWREPKIPVQYISPGKQATQGENDKGKPGVLVQIPGHFLHSSAAGLEH